MSKNNENKLVPKFRFPEFAKDSEWTENHLGGLCQYWNGASNESGVCDDGNYFLISLNSIDINGNLKDEIKKISYTDNSLKTNDLVMVLSDVAHGNFLGLTDIIPNDNYVLNQRMAGLRIKDLNEVNPQFIRYYINKSQKYFKSKGQGSSQLNLSKSAVTDFPVLKPPKLKEQQKVAACLSSLDEVITAESQKLEVLKDHKKGLLQNLLPQAGETVPKFRFKEFEDSGEWVEKRLDEIADFLKGKGISKADVDDKGKQPCIRYGELYTHYGEVIKEIKSFTNLNEEDLMLSEPNDVIIPSSGETKEDIATASCVKLGGVALGGDLNILRSSLNGDFLAYYLSHGLKKAISKIAQGDAVVHLYATQLKKLIIRVPIKKKEQERIADMISPLDDLINIQNQKLETLQLHKKGLLQGLFPSLSETGIAGLKDEQDESK